MNVCVYCENNSTTATFNGCEHVIPKLMGSFENNLTLANIVCDNCNSKIFSPLETIFKEDTEEGIYYQMFNFQNSFQIRIKNNNVKTTFSTGLGNTLFNEMFPFFEFTENHWKVSIRPQFKIKRHGKDGYWILLIEPLKKLSKNKLLKVKKLLDGVTSKDIVIFTKGNTNEDKAPHREAVELLKELGIDYKEGKSDLAPTEEVNSKRVFEISMNCNLGAESGRVIAKIAFNYFCYCAIKEKRRDILFHSNFEQIKLYIIGKLVLPIKQVVTQISDEPVIFDEKVGGRRFIGHTVTFEEKDGNLSSTVSFIGKRIYTVVLGKIPDEFKRDDFGCGHMFDPINKKIHQLTMDLSKWGSGQETGFGLYKKI